MQPKPLLIAAALAVLGLVAFGLRPGTASQPANAGMAAAAEVGRFHLVTDKNISPAFLLDTTTGQVWERTAGAGGATSTWKEVLAAPKSK
jgi:hypothetical protein